MFSGCVIVNRKKNEFFFFDEFYAKSRPINRWTPKFTIEKTPLTVTANKDLCYIKIMRGEIHKSKAMFFFSTKK